MWKYLIANAVGFFTILSVHFFGRKPSQVLAAGVILAAAAFALFQAGTDPFSWLFYLSSSAIVFWSARQFKRWSLSESTAVDEDLNRTAQKAASVESAVERKSEETDQVYRRANSLAHLYETIQEISKSLDRLEALAVFGQALYNHFEFIAITMAFFDNDEAGSRDPSEVFKLLPSHFSDVFDKSAFLKNKDRLKIAPAAFEQRILEAVFKSRQPLNTVDSLGGSPGSPIRLWPDFKPFVAYPIFMEGRIFSVLILSGVTEQNFQSLLILIQRFISEMQRIRLYQKIQTLAITDGLTGVYVRRHLMERLEGELLRSWKFGLKLSLLMIDIDNFKQFNDLYGHLVGDAVLKQVAEGIKKNIREIDLVGRYGGEEFAVLLIETDESAAFFVAERIRRAIQERTVRAWDENLQVTVSIGCATLSGAWKDAVSVIEGADAGLYQAKKEGKNRVCFYNAPGP